MVPNFHLYDRPREPYNNQCIKRYRSREEIELQNYEKIISLAFHQK